LYQIALRGQGVMKLQHLPRARRGIPSVGSLDQASTASWTYACWEDDPLTFQTCRNSSRCVHNLVTFIRL